MLREWVGVKKKEHERCMGGKGDGLSLSLSLPIDNQPKVHHWGGERKNRELETMVKGKITTKPLRHTNRVQCRTIGALTNNSY